MRGKALWVLALALSPVAAYSVLVAAKGRKGALATLLGPVERTPVAFETLELKRTPNQYLVCPPGLCRAQAHAESPRFAASVERLRGAWLELMAAEPNVETIRSDQSLEQYDFEALTPLAHFPDTVTVRFMPTEDGGSTLAIYSRSHYGQSDFGANGKRIRRWLKAIEERLQAS